MFRLFERERSVLTKHINNVFKEAELELNSNVQNLHIAYSDSLPRARGSGSKLMAKTGSKLFTIDTGDALHLAFAGNAAKILYSLDCGLLHTAKPMKVHVSQGIKT